MGEQSYATTSLRPLSHKENRRGESVGGTRVPFARDAWEESVTLSPLHLSLPRARTHTHGCTLKHLLSPFFWPMDEKDGGKESIN